MIKGGHRGGHLEMAGLGPGWARRAGRCIAVQYNAAQGLAELGWAELGWAGLEGRKGQGEAGISWLDWSLGLILPCRGGMANTGTLH